MRLPKRFDAISRGSSEPGAVNCSCPTISESTRGRIRAASGWCSERCNEAFCPAGSLSATDRVRADLAPEAAASALPTSAALASPKKSACSPEGIVSRNVHRNHQGPNRFQGAAYANAPASPKAFSTKHSSNTFLPPLAGSADILVPSHRL